MSTDELIDYIEARTYEEQQMMASYLRRKFSSSSQLDLSEEELADLDRRVDEMKAGINCVTQEEAEARWAELERQGR